MTIHIEELEFLAIIGLLDFERITPQTVIIDAQIGYYYQDNEFINYADVISLIEHLIVEKKYELLEDALREVQDKIIKKYPQIIKLNFKISKPNIIKNAKVALSLEYLSNS